MNSSEQIIEYLEELAKALTDLRVPAPFHLLITGGAYMLLQNQRRSTLDIDFALIEPSRKRIRPDRVFPMTIKKAEISGNSTVPYAAEFKEAVEIVAQNHKNLPADWMNDEAAVYFYDDAPNAQGTFGRAFENILFVYLPTMEYILATKIAAYRPKDLGDIKILIQELGIQTREQVKAIVDAFLLPEAQEFWEVEKKLKRLFR